MHIGGGWILEVDIRKFFDTLDHAHLRTFLQNRMRDGVLKRLIGKWLKAGVMEDGNVSYPDSGSRAPTAGWSGGVISPILANVFLHYVLDTWFEEEVKPRLRGRACLIRYADDFVIGFTREDDARLERPATKGATETTGPARSPYWASPTIGDVPGRVAGW